MSERAPWTIESIRDTLGAPVLARRFLDEINRAPAAQLVLVFAKWQRIAEDTVGAVERARGISAGETASEDGRGVEHFVDGTGGWVDITERVQRDAEHARARGAA